MKKLVITTMVIIGLFSAGSAKSYDAGDIGIGVMVGDPAGLTMKFWTSDNTAFVGSIGTSYFGELLIIGDYLWHLPFGSEEVFSFHAGFGGVLGVGRGDVLFSDDRFSRADNDIGLGIRGIAGIDVSPADSPFEFYLEGGMLFGIAPDLAAGVNASLGARFYF